MVWRRLIGLCLLVVGSGAAAGAIHNFTPNSGGHVVYGIISSLLAVPALLGGVYVLISRSGFTIDRNAHIIIEWISIAGLQRASEHDLDSCTAIEVKKYWYFNRTRQPGESFYCELRIWSTEGEGDDIVLTRKMRESEANLLAEELAVFMSLPIEFTRGGARGVVADD